MARTVGLAGTTARTIANRPPRLLIIAGATGTGKSTSMHGKIGAKSNFARLISTDAIREILRSTDEERENSCFTVPLFRLEIQMMR